MKINNLLQTLFLLGILVAYSSCTNKASNSVSVEQGTRLDTITSMDQLGGTIIKVVKLHLDEVEVTVDTVLTIDYDTYEEKIEITETKGPRQEIVSMEYIPK